jgi:integrase
VNSVGLGAPFDPDVVTWLNGLSTDFYGKLVTAGLVPARQAKCVAALGPFIERYIDGRHDVKPRTKLVLRQAQQSLVGYFGEDRPLDTISEGDAELWWQSMVQDGLAEATRRKRAQHAKQIFRFAGKQGLVSSNPFRDLKSSAVANDKRLHYVSLEDIEKVISVSPDAEWRLLWALCRFAGLRCPSEVMALTWDDILWDQSRMVVTSEKTERHAGGATRVVPIFGALRPYLDEAFAQAAPGPVYCIARHRLVSANLRTTGRKIIRRAGLVPWERTFQNLRASAEMDLTQQFPLHVCSEWLGHSGATAMKHYLKARDEDFDLAATCLDRAHIAPQSDAEPCAQSRTEQKVTSTGAIENDSVLSVRGLRHPAKSPIAQGVRTFRPGAPKTPISQEQSAQDYTPVAPDSPSDPDLAEIVRRWPGLHPAVKEHVLSIVRGSDPDAY